MQLSVFSLKPTLALNLSNDSGIVKYPLSNVGSGTMLKQIHYFIHIIIFHTHDFCCLDGLNIGIVSKESTKSCARMTSE